MFTCADNWSMAAALSPQKAGFARTDGTVPHECVYRSGSFAPVSVPFSLRLISCSAEVWRHVGIAFAGVTPAEDPHVFWPAARVSVMPESAALFDDQQRQIIPNTLPLHYAPILTSEMTLHFTARYRAISENMTPGRIHSEVWFTLVYP